MLLGCQADGMLQIPRAAPDRDAGIRHLPQNSADIPTVSSHHSSRAWHRAPQTQIKINIQKAKKLSKTHPSLPPTHGDTAILPVFSVFFELFNASESSSLLKHLFQEFGKLSWEICAARHALKFN